MATITSKYTIKISGWQGRVIKADGTEGVTALYCMGDKNFLDDTLSWLKSEGEIKSYEIVWTEVEHTV